MTFAAKHFDPQLGIDIHLYSVPPGPYPTVHIGMVFDPFDYIPPITLSGTALKVAEKAGSALGGALDAAKGALGVDDSKPEPAPVQSLDAPGTQTINLGATIFVGGVRRAHAGTFGLDIHIPLGIWTPPLKGPGGPQFDDELFMGSKTVLADQEPFSRIGMPVLDCNIVGMIPPLRLKPKPKVPLSLLLPTALNVAIPTNVFIGGPPTISWNALLFRAGFAVVRKAMRGARKLTAALNRKLFGHMKPGFLKCKVLRAEPVDIRDGSVSVEDVDFEIPGRLPLAWPRSYGSNTLRRGLFGHGWQTPADLRLEIDAEDGSVLFIDNDHVAVFPGLPLAAGPEHAVAELVEGARLSRVSTPGGERLQVWTKDDLCYLFGLPGDDGPAVLPIERIEDLCGNHWRFERGADGRPTRIVESAPDAPEGRSIELGLGHGGIERIALHDPATGLRHPLANYRYDSAGDLVAVQDAMGAVRSFEYVEHHMVRHTDRLGLSFHYAYDSAWQVVRAWGDNGLYDYRFEYDALLRETRLRNSLGAQWIVKFDENGLPLCEIDPLDGVTVFEYDQVGRTTAVTDPNGLRTAFSYDEDGNLLQLLHPDGTTVTATYDAAQRPVRVTDACGAAWTQQWTAQGLLASRTDPLGATAHYTYDRHGQLATQTNPRGAVTRLTFDRHGSIERFTDPLGHASTFRHDALGHLIAQTDALGRTTRYGHDRKGRVIRIGHPDGSEVHCSYDAEDQLTRYVDERSGVTQMDYAGLGQLVRRVQPDGHVVTYRYDTEEQLTGIVNQRGESYTLVNDALGRIVEEVDWWGQRRRYQYDAGGRLQATRDPLGQIISCGTDAMGRITHLLLPDADNPSRQVRETFTYDKSGRTTGMRNACREVKRQFDALGQLIEEEQDGFRIAHGYDAAGNRVTRRTDAGHTLAIDHDLCDRPTSLRIDDDAPIVIQRNALGQIVSEQLAERVKRHFSYDERGLLSAQTAFRDHVPLFDTRYDYDTGGRLVRRQDSRHGTDRYSYDPMGRILEHVDPGGRLTRQLADPAGDRMRTRIHEVQMRQVAGGEGAAQTLWTRQGEHDGVQYVFDRAGDLIGKGRDAQGLLQLRWDAHHRLIESLRDGQLTRYGYDPVGRRVFKRNPTHTTWFFWDGDALVGEVTERNDAEKAPAPKVVHLVNPIEIRRRREALRTLHGRVREYVYYPGTFVPLALLARESATEAGAFHFHVDPNGEPVRITDREGAIRWSRDETPDLGARVVANPLRFQGQYFDDETGLHYARYRYYDPDGGNFISEDPIGLEGGLNGYEYAPNPLSWTDPLGLARCSKAFRRRQNIAKRWVGHLTAKKPDDVASFLNSKGFTRQTMREGNRPGATPHEVFTRKTKSGTTYQLDHHPGGDDATHGSDYWKVYRVDNAGNREVLGRIGHGDFKKFDRIHDSPVYKDGVLMNGP